MIMNGDIINDDESSKLIEDIFNFKQKFCPELNTIDTILEYCYKYDRNIQDVGNIISEHQEFLKILEKQLIREKYIKGAKNSEEFFDDSDW